MPELKACFEQAGFENVRTLLASGNVAFDSRSTSPAAIAQRAQRAMEARLGHAFEAHVRSSEHLRRLVEADPFAAFPLEPAAKRVVAFLREPAPADLALPPARDGARILQVLGAEVLAAYVPGPKGPVFMAVLERTFGKHITTRTWDTVRKCTLA